MAAIVERSSSVHYDVGEHEDRPWGTWQVVDAGAGFITKRIEVMAGHRLSLQFHRHRAEHWVIVGGRGEAIIGDTTAQLGPGDYVSVPCGAKHRICNTGTTPLVFIEVQFGDLLDESDIVRLDDDYLR